ncbi:MAG TPA: hypothetical protein VGN63_04480 [Flavisolibacter sp.]|jgi:hypothetical protein|nr:hypothetical protein [Flavisolibacter sp.]
MKKLLIGTLALTLATASFAQKGKGKGHKQETSREEVRRVVLGEPSNDKKQKGNKNDDAVWEGISGKGGPKTSKNQPAKVRQAFAADYPNASHVRWSKYRGDWTATFTNGPLTSTAVYHANGQRKDTRTAVGRPQLPRAIEEVFRKRPAIRIGNIVRIELPVKEENLFRVQTIDGSTSLFTVYNASGKVVHYDY